MNRQLIAYRKTLNMSQTDMAKAIGMCLTSYNLKENGKSDFTQRHNPNVTIDEIFFSQSVNVMITT